MLCDTTIHSVNGMQKISNDTLIFGSIASPIDTEWRLNRLLRSAVDWILAAGQKFVVRKLKKMIFTSKYKIESLRIIL